MLRGTCTQASSPGRRALQWAGVLEELKASVLERGAGQIGNGRGQYEGGKARAYRVMLGLLGFYHKSSGKLLMGFKQALT